MSRALSTSVLLFFSLLQVVGSGRTNLTVAAAADLSPLEKALTANYRRSHGDVVIRFVFQASASLAQGIENGAPYDVFLSANADWVERLAGKKKVLPDSIRAYARGKLAILWKGDKKHELADLQSPGIRVIALPNPRLAPYGLAAQQALEHAGLWKSVEKKVVLGENVRQTLQLFDSGNADVVLTSLTLLQGRKAGVVDPAWYQPLLQKGAVVAGSGHPREAKAFLEYLTSPEGQRILSQFGLDRP